MTAANTPATEASDSASTAGPLTGYRVLELGTTVAGPFCARLMADFGAEVIKVEPFEGDPIRFAGRHFEGKSLYAASILRNKRLIAVDLRQERGRDIVRRLVPTCDVVVENMRPGALEKWGLGYDDLVKLRPDLVMVRISGFGQSGPYRMTASAAPVGKAIRRPRRARSPPQTTFRSLGRTAIPGRP